MFIAIMATIMPMLEKLGESKIQTPEAYIWTRSVVTILKGMLMMSVFVVNGLSTDFFIGCSFLCTTTIGYLYFVVNRYKDHLMYDHSQVLKEDRMQKQVRVLQKKLQSEVYSQILGFGFKVVSVTTLILFTGMVLIAVNTPAIPLNLLKIKVEGQFEVNSMSIAAIILILYNLFTWVSYTQSLKKGPHFSEADSELDRAKLLVKLMDDVCETCSTISN